MGPKDDLAFALLTPPGRKGAHVATTAVGKYESIPVTMASNARAQKTITDTTLPAVAFDAMGYMRHMFRDAPNDWKLLASGGFGSAFLVTVTDVTKPRLQRLYNEVTNKVEHAHINYVPNKTKLVLKVITAGRENRYWEPKAEEKRYLEHREAEERKKRGVAHVENKNIDPAVKRAIDDAVRVSKSLLHAMDVQKRRAYLKAFVERKKRAKWDFVLETGSLDASNHEYIMSRPPVTFKCATGTATVRARDVIPKLYFGGSHKPYGVYAIVMGFVDGDPLKSITPSPDIVANLEKAMLTLAASGIEHGDAHTANIFANLNGDVRFIDFGMSVIMPRESKQRALRKLGACVRALQTTGTWPEHWSNSVWYGDDHKGKNTRSVMRYLNSYMKAKGYVWYNPSGKMLRFMKTHTTKAALNVARTYIWSKVCKACPGCAVESVRRRSPSPNSPLNLTASSLEPTPVTTRAPRASGGLRVSGGPRVSTPRVKSQTDSHTRRNRPLQATAQRAPQRRRKAAQPKMRKHRRITPLEPVHTRAPARRRKAAQPKMRKHRRITPLSSSKNGNV